MVSSRGDEILTGGLEGVAHLWHILHHSLCPRALQAWNPNHSGFLEVTQHRTLRPEQNRVGISFLFPFLFTNLGFILECNWLLIYNVLFVFKCTVRWHIFIYTESCSFMDSFPVQVIGQCCVDFPVLTVDIRWLSILYVNIYISSVQLLSHVCLFAIPWTAALLGFPVDICIYVCVYIYIHTYISVYLWMPTF